MNLTYRNEVVPGVFLSGGSGLAIAAIVVHVLVRVALLAVALYVAAAFVMVVIPIYVLGLLAGPRRRRRRSGLWGREYY